MKKNILIIVAAIAVLVLVAVCCLRNCNNYASIQKYVSRNQDALCEYAAKLMAGEEVKLPSRIKSAQVFGGTVTVVEFYMPSFTGQYCGFYYSKEDVPAAFQNTDVTLNETGDNTWEWSADGDNHGKTIKIADCWYYFEANL